MKRVKLTKEEKAIEETLDEYISVKPVEIKTIKKALKAKKNKGN